MADWMKLDPACSAAADHVCLPSQVRKAIKLHCILKQVLYAKGETGEYLCRDTPGNK